MLFTKKPVTIEAITFEEFVALTDGQTHFVYNGHPCTHENDSLWLIPTLEGMHNFTPADMLITGVVGEIYPCKKEIFEKTYKAAFAPIDGSDDTIPAMLYDVYCHLVGGKAYNGDKLPPSSEFFADKNKELQANAWRGAAASLNAAPFINLIIKQNNIPTDDISDGYHTFGELYEHRITNYLVLCRVLVAVQNNTTLFKREAYEVWRSKNHSDGQPAFGGTWFVLGIGKLDGEQITYHLPIEAWDKAYFAKELDKAPQYDGHSPEDVLNRLAKL